MSRSNVNLVLAIGLLLVAVCTSQAGPVSLRTGSARNVDGYLNAQPDDYGAVTNFTTPLGLNGDEFNPGGSAAARVVTFTNGFFLFGPNSQRELLSDETQWQNTYPADASLDRAVTSANVAIDTNSDGINDQANSAFRVFGGTTDLGFQLKQNVVSVSSSVSYLRQDYVVTNNGTGAISFSMVRSGDFDLVWGGTAANDSVGTTSNGAGVGPYASMQEVGQDTQSVTQSNGTGQSYYGGRESVLPPNGPPAMGFGTDVQVWDAFGIPASWVDYIANIGYNTNGQSGPTPGGDAFIGLGSNFTMEEGQSLCFTNLVTYGQTSPVTLSTPCVVPEPATVSLVALGAIGLLALRRRG